MSSMKDLVRGECGTSNALMKTTQHLTKDQALRSIRPNQPGSSLANEFLQQHPGNSQPSTFHMQHLLKEIHEVEHPASTTSKAPINHPNAQWIDEFHKMHPQTNPNSHLSFDNTNAAAQQWPREFNQGAASLHHPPPSALDHPPPTRTYQVRPQPWMQGPSRFAQPMPMFNPAFQHQSRPPTEPIEVPTEVEAMQSTDTTENQVLEDAWESAKEESKDETKEAAKKVMEQMKNDEKMRNSNFFSFMKKLAGNESNESSQFDEFLKSRNMDFVNRTHQLSEDERSLRLDEEMDSFVDNYANSYNIEEDVEGKWKDYDFAEENPFTEIPNAFEQGMKRYEAGDLSNAVLLFEAAVLSDKKDSAEAWYYLGQSQAQNEQEDAAIRALYRSLELDSNHLPSLMALAVSHTNESQIYEAVCALKRWLETNSSYSQQSRELKNVILKKTDFVFSTKLNSSESYKAVEEAFIKATYSSPLQSIDADVQCGLGILSHLCGNFDQAADCFNSALSVRPNDALLWNKLGATLANGNKSAEAVEAYRRALSLNPGFVRSRYNLGISCMNLDANSAAVEHFLTALDAQRSASGPNGKVGQMSTSVWGTLVMVLTLMGDEEAKKIARERDLDSLMAKFQVPTLAQQS